MTIRPPALRNLTRARDLVLPAALFATLVAAACSPAAEKPATNSAPSNANSAASNANAGGATNANTAAANSNAAAGASKAKLNLNTASEEEFKAAIPGFGDRMAHEFEEYRPYKSIQQFRKEIAKYVSASQVAEYEKYVFVPVSENESDAATLQQIPGLDAAEAQELIAGRPYASREAFISKLATKVSADELAVARTYLSNQ
jgi:DNA uptake protein ComE-like DNA-binding protein